MLAIGADENRVGIPATKDPTQSARCREKPAVRCEWNDLERFGDRRMPWLAGLTARRYREVNVAVRCDKQGDLGSALGDAASRASEQSRGTRPVAGAMEK